MSKIFDFTKELDKYGLNQDKFEELLSDCSNKVQKITDVEWSEIVDKYKLGIHYDSLRKASQTPFGGAFVAEYFKQKLSESNEHEYLNKLRFEKQEIKKERQKLSDERTEFNRQIREMARKESFLEMIKRIITEDVTPMELSYYSPTIVHKSDNDLLCHLTDIHTGIKINNFVNTFNEDMLKLRIEQYTQEILEIRKRHSSENCYLVIGEILSGLIHNNLRLQNNMDLLEQFKYISELISSMLITLSSHFNQVHVYTTPGNHSRIVAQKGDSLDGENMDILLPFYLKARLQNIHNVNIFENTVEPEIAMFSIRDKIIFSSHGHKDSPSNVVQNFTMLFGVKPDIVLLGHRHTNGLTTVFDTKVIESGCVSGTDQYALSIRKANKPEQTISVINNKGLLCLYDIQLD